MKNKFTNIHEQYIHTVPPPQPSKATAAAAIKKTKSSPPPPPPSIAMKKKAPGLPKPPGISKSGTYFIY